MSTESIKLVFKTTDVTHRLAVQRRQQGFSLIDLLVALMLTSIMINGLLRYQHASIYQLQRIKDSHSGWQLAAQILDIYPNQPTLSVNEGHYIINKMVFNRRCEWVSVHVTTPLQQTIVQRRLICLD